MTYRAPLIDPDRLIRHDLGSLLTDAQWAKLALWSYQQGQDVRTILSDWRPIAEQVGETNQIRLTGGPLPHCGLVGSLEPDGSCHA